jgi:hypothetical protein
MQARRALFPGGIPGHSFLRSATQCPTANLSRTVAFDDHNIKMVPIIRMIFSTVTGARVPYAKTVAASNIGLALICFTTASLVIEQAHSLRARDWPLTYVKGRLPTCACLKGSRPRKRVASTRAAKASIDAAKIKKMKADGVGTSAIGEGKIGRVSVYRALAE